MRKLEDRIRTGGTPSTAHPEYWSGSIPSRSVQDRIVSATSSIRAEARKLKADATAALEAAKRKIENLVEKQ